MPVRRPGRPPDAAGVAPLEVDHGAVDRLRARGLRVGGGLCIVHRRVAWDDARVRRRRHLRGVWVRVWIGVGIGVRVEAGIGARVRLG